MNPRVQAAFASFDPGCLRLVGILPESKRRREEQLARRAQFRLLKQHDVDAMRVVGSQQEPAELTPEQAAEQREIVRRYAGLCSTDAQHEALASLAACYARGDEGAQRRLLSFVRGLQGVR